MCVNSMTLMNQVRNTTLSRTSSYIYTNLWTGYQFLESPSPIQFSIEVVSRVLLRICVRGQRHVDGFQ